MIDCANILRGKHLNCEEGHLYFLMNLVDIVEVTIEMNPEFIEKETYWTQQGNGDLKKREKYSNLVRLFMGINIVESEFLREESRIAGCAWCGESSIVSKESPYDRKADKR